VLVVDDDDTSRYLLSTLLSSRTCQLSEALNGEQGLQMARELKPDLIVLDLAMPDKSGFEVLRLLKHDSSTAHIPVVICTSYEAFQKSGLQAAMKVENQPVVAQ